jgi:hypothetical protein
MDARHYLGNPANQAVGQKARQLRAQATSVGTAPPGTTKKLIGRAAVGAEPKKVRAAQAHKVITHKRGNA